jgi:hypothetical protein
MSEFCKQCSILIFGEDFGNLKGISKPEDAEKNIYPIVICEGCGPIQVNPEGECISNDCLKAPHK